MDGNNIVDEALQMHVPTYKLKEERSTWRATSVFILIYILTLVRETEVSSECPVRTERYALVILVGYR
jgi:hypothetical protein